MDAAGECLLYANIELQIKKELTQTVETVE